MAQTGDIYLARFILDVQGNPASVGFHYQQTAGPVEDVDRTGALAQGLQAIAGEIADFVATQTRVAQLHVSQVDDGISGIPDAPSTGIFANTASARAGDALPLTNAVVCKLFQNDLAGKFNGRQYWPGISELDTDGNVVTTQLVLNQIEDLNDNARIISETVGGDTFDFQHVIWHPNNLPPDATPVVDTSASPTIFSQRRRQTRRRLASA